MLDVISQDNSRNNVFHFEIKAKVALQEREGGSKRKGFEVWNPIPWIPPPSPSLGSPQLTDPLSPPPRPLPAPAAYTSHQQAFLLGW